MGSILGGSSTTKTEIPKWLEDAARTNLSRADYIGSLGYTPYYGADVAALTPTQLAAMQNTNQGAGAFGMAGADPTAGMPQAQNFGGVSGYSSGGMFDQALSELQQRRPGQYGAINSMFIDPVSGAAPITPFGMGNVPAPGAGQPGGFGGAQGDMSGFGLDVPQGNYGTGAGSGLQGLGGLLSGGMQGLGGMIGNGGIIGGIFDALGGGRGARK